MTEETQQFFKPAPYIKPSINVGALLDIPTGQYKTGKYGESILDGGLAHVTGIASIGNSFKTTFSDYMALSAFDKIIYSNNNTNVITYDTESNKEIQRFIHLSKQFPTLSSLDIYNDNFWILSDRTSCLGDEWYESLKSYLADRKKNSKNTSATYPFLDKDQITLIKNLIPSIGQLDSLTEFETSDVAKMKLDNELGESGGNTIFMRQGLAKFRLMSELSSLTVANAFYCILTAQVGKDIIIPQGPGTPSPTKKNQHLKPDTRIKGASDKFLQTTLNCWHIHNSKTLINDSTKGAEYPLDDGSYAGDTDLNVISLRQLRSKFGPSGYNLDLLVSQNDGILPSLTEFHFIKNYNRFGLSGTQQHYSLDLLPDIKLQRTTVRSKINEYPELRRALNITSELAQMHLYWRNLNNGILCTPAQLYQDLKDHGYDWSTLLKTRGWWTMNNDEQDIPFLSTLDLLNMRLKLYQPYWLK